MRKIFAPLLMRMQQLLIILFLLFSFSCSGNLDRDDLLSGDFGSVDKSAPELISPVDGSKVYSLEATLIWTSKQNANQYIVEIAQDENFTQMLAGFPLTTSVAYLEVTFPEANSYYWRVKTDIGGEANQSQTYKIHLFDGTLYIHCPDDVDSCSNEGMAGTKRLPYQIIDSVLAEALDAGLEVHVASRGNGEAYEESIYLLNGLTITGGYNASDWTRDISSYETKISSSKPVTIRAYNVSNATLFDGFIVESQCDDIESCYTFHIENCNDQLTLSNNTIYGGKGNNAWTLYNKNSQNHIVNNTIYGGAPAYSSYSIYNDGGETTSSNNTIYGGEGGTRSYAIYNSASQAVITDNYIDGGTTTDQTHGIKDESSSTTIYGNIILGGFGDSISYGISSYIDSTSLIYNNLIHGGNGSSSYGVYIYRSDPIIKNNTINGGQGGSKTTAITLVNYPEPASGEIVNNILFTSSGTERYCIHESHYSASTDSDPTKLQNNNFFDCPTALYRDEDSNNFTSISNGKPGDTDVASSITSGNVSIDNAGDQLFVDIDGPDNDILTMNDNNWQLNVADASICDVVYGGLDLSAEFTFDLLGSTRTALLPGCMPSNTGASGWSMGAFERD